MNAYVRMRHAPAAKYDISPRFHGSIWPLRSAVVRMKRALGRYTLSAYGTGASAVVPGDMAEGPDGS